MTAVIREHDVTVLCGDVREQLATLADGSVQCVVTSPPYYGLRDYGMAGQLGLEASPAEYVMAMRAVFADVRRVLADDGVLWLNVGDSYASSSTYNTSRTVHTVNGWKQDADRRPNVQARALGIAPKNLLGVPWRVAFALRDDGWTLRNAVIWHKPNAMPESVTDRLSCRYEHVFLFSKSRRYQFDLDAVREPLTSTRDAALTWDRPLAKERANEGQRVQKRPGRTWEQRKAEGESDGGGRNPGDVWTVPTSPFPGSHFATMPPELARRCILAGCPDGGTVLDPFAGSGTTLMVARNLGRKSIGIELNPAYIDIIRGRIGQTPIDFGSAS